MQEPILLEICAGSLVSALIAQSGKADRIELCENLQLGGTTPSFGTFSIVKKMITIPVHVLIRPRSYNFHYTEFEIAVMKMDIEACKMIGFEGVVLGALKADKTIDAELCREMITLARPLSVTFHRAFDEVPDPFTGLQTLMDLGFDRVLTSGTEKKAIEGKETLAKLIKMAGDRIMVMPGGGIRPENVKELLDHTAAREIHSSAINHFGNLQETDLQTVIDLKHALALSNE